VWVSGRARRRRCGRHIIAGLAVSHAPTAELAAAAGAERAALLRAEAFKGARVLLGHTSPDGTADGDAWRPESTAPVAGGAGGSLAVFSAPFRGAAQRVFKAVARLPRPAADVARAIANNAARLKWDANILRLETAEVEPLPGGGGGGAAGGPPGPLVCVFYSATKAVGPISGRDFTDATYIGPLAALPADVRSAAPAGPSPHAWVNGGAGLPGGAPAFPESPAAVRGLNLFGSGFVVEPGAEGEGGCVVHYVVQPTLSGWMLPAIINMTLNGVLKTYFDDLLGAMARGEA